MDERHRDRDKSERDPNVDGTRRDERDRERARQEPGEPTKTLQRVTAAILVLGLLTAIFVLQNTRDVTIEFLFWQTTVPLAAALLLATVLGGILAFLVAYIRQRQFRRALKRK